MNLKVGLFLVGLSFLLLGCSPAGKGGAGVKAVLAIPDDPVAIAVSVDDAHAVEARISPEGGSLNATGSDGSAYELAIPPGALATETTIRMTPVGSVSGMPFGGDRSYAVHLQPEGLQLYAAAILTITPAEEIPLDQQLFFGYAGEGSNLSLAAPVVDAREIRIQVHHFSGYGVTRGLLADIEPVRQRLGGDAETRLQNAAAERLTRERQKQLSGIESEETLDLDDLFKEYEKQVVQPRVAAAGESCANARLALQTVLGFERQRELLGRESDAPLEGLNGLLDTATEVCMKEEYEICRDEHVVNRIVPAWLGMERTYQLFGLDDGAGAAPALQQARDYVRRCLSFELNFTSRIVLDDGAGGGFTSAMDSSVPLQVEPETMSFRAAAPLDNTEFEYHQPDCNVVSTPGGTDFTVMDLDFTIRPFAEDASGGVSDVYLNYITGASGERVTIQCDDETFTTPPAVFWTGVYMMVHEDELNLTQGGFAATGWDVLGGELFARKEWSRSDAGVGAIEEGSFELHHRPQ